MSGKLSSEDDPNPKKLRTTGEMTGPEKFMVPAPSEGMTPMSGTEAFETIRRLRGLVEDQYPISTSYYVNTSTNDDGLKKPSTSIDDHLKSEVTRDDRLKSNPSFKVMVHPPGRWFVYNEESGDRFETPTGIRAHTLQDLLNVPHQSRVRVLRNRYLYEVRYVLSRVVVFVTYSESEALRLQDLINKNVRRE